MEAVEVVAEFDRQGKVRPLRFTWQGQVYVIESTGRRWDDPAGKHILAMAVGGQVYELVFAASEGLWYLGRARGGRAAA